MTDANPLYAWLKEQGFWLSAGDTSARPITHLFLDGGKAHVPDDKTIEFYQEYASCIRKGIPQYVVEQRTPAFRLFIDVDIRSKFPLPQDMIERMSACLYGCSREFFAPLSSSMIVCLAPDRQLPDGMHKTGIHLHWPRVFITSSKALTFRTLCITRCTEEFGDCFAVGWGNIIDAAVYRSSGLRMIYSLKRNATGVYVPRLVFQPDGSVQTASGVLEALETWLQDVSIRVSRVVDPTTVAGGSGDSTDASHEELLIKTEHNKGTLQRMSLAEARTRSMAVALETSLPPFFRNCKVTSIYKIVPRSKKADHIKYIFGTNCKNCMNKVSGFHRSNHVYFMVSASGVHQRCFCRCDTCEGRRYGECRDFSQKVCDLSAGLGDLAYGKPNARIQVSSCASGKDITTLSETILRGYR